MKKIPAEPMKAIAKPMQRIAGKPMKRVRRVPLFVPTTDENGNEAFKKNPVLMQKVITVEKAKELETMLFNFDAEVIAAAQVVNDVTKRPATYEARKQLIETLRELSETCRGFSNILDAEVIRIQTDK